MRKPQITTANFTIPDPLKPFFKTTPDGKTRPRIVKILLNADDFIQALSKAINEVTAAK